MRSRRVAAGSFLPNLRRPLLKSALPCGWGRPSTGSDSQIRRTHKEFFDFRNLTINRRIENSVASLGRTLEFPFHSKIGANTPLRPASKKQAPPWPYTTRLQKGGALLEETRALVRAWSDAPTEELRERIVQTNLLNKQTRARMGDVYQRTFLPRFIRGPIPNAWKFVRPLEDADAPLAIVRPIYYWISAKAEPLLSDFCREYILPRAAIVRAGIGTEEVVCWLHSKGCRWSPTVARKVARGLLAALRDFGLLEGRAKKRLASFSLPIAAFAYLALCLRATGAVSHSLVRHPDWELFLLRPGDVEHFFLLAHQDRLLEYHAAGSTVSISFPTESLNEYAHVVAQRSL